MAKFIVTMGLIIFILIIRKIRIQIANPYLIFSLIWGIAISMYLIPVFQNFSQLTLYTLLLIVLTTSMLFIGIFLGEKTVNINKIHMKSYSLKKMEYVSVLILILVLISFVITLIVLGRPPALGGEIDRADYYLSGVENIYLLIYVFWFINLYLLKNKYKFVTNVYLLIISLVPVLLKGNKFQFIVLLIMVLFFISLQKKIKLFYIFISLIGVIIIFLLSSKLYLNDSSKELLLEVKSNETGYILRGSWYMLMDPLLYLTNSFMNLNNYMSLNTPIFGGLNVFSGVNHLFMIDKIFQDKYISMDIIWFSSLRYKWLTTGTYLKSLVMDFGYIGSIIATLPIGLLIGRYWKKIKCFGIEASLTSLFIYIMCYIFVFLSFFTFYLSSNELVVNIFVVVLVHKFCLEKRY